MGGVTPGAEGAPLPLAQAGPPENAFIALGRSGQRNSFWVTALVFTAEAFVFLVVSLVVGVIAILSLGRPVTSIDALPPLVVLIVAGLPFLAALPTLLVGVRAVNRRPFLSLITPLPRPRWGRFWRAGLVWLGINLLGDLVLALVISPGNYVFQFEPLAFLPYALVALLLIPIQSATEELTFRGYLLQGIGVATRNAWVAWVATSVLFGLLHGAHQELSSSGAGLLVDYVGLGLFLGWLTVRSQGLETSIGVHIATNLYGTLAVTFPGSSLPAPALFRTVTFNPLLNSLVLLVGIALFLVYFYGYELKKAD